MLFVGQPWLTGSVKDKTRMYYWSTTALELDIWDWDLLGLTELYLDKWQPRIFGTHCSVCRNIEAADIESSLHCTRPYLTVSWNSIAPVGCFQFYVDCGSLSTHLCQCSQDEADEDVSAELSHREAEAEVAHGHDRPQEHHGHRDHPHLEEHHGHRADHPDLGREKVGEAE